ncbi:proline:sodium symporter PutP [Moraxella bovoculi]|uniref:Sodium/proline symporter n=1 Tax=Moraxella bovoculi TaxID=386891 RepID=A0AAC8PU76_9GAMM|nr:sodium/proline symporter PutP [Moraxella bovoculi]AKG07018.1 proline:sodium symporter PutP [Moraxella bovoculi]AKG09006.1 proline:sodium symporter PutP [Moraxella bovoculi]AKG10839.1 proline:sodium symporter PutP [Moraxella bovoculi]AKG12876.1 proline:sodium symporter PutP [Moraxella bovoculi]
MSSVATGVWISLAIYFMLMIAIGVYAYFKQQNNVEGYMLGGRQLSPAVAALSAGASDMSGWLILGLPGYMYASGIVSLWIAGGLTLGAFVNYLLVAPRLRVFTEIADNALTLPDYFSNRFNDTSHLLRIMSAVVIIVFFTVYTAASLVGGGKLFESSLGMSYDLGIWLTAGVVVAYTLFGGFLAVSLTDFVQGVIMLVAMLLVPIVAFSEIGGLSAGIEVARSVNPELFNIMSGVTVMGAISLAAWGLGYFGQPHIIVRFMAIRSVKDVPTARNIGMSWMIVSLIGALMVGLSGVAYIHNHNMELADPETIFLVFSQLLFHPLISGFLLAAILAAIMSTISSQLLVASSSLTRDIYKLFLDKDASEARQVLVGRICVVAVALLAIFIAGNKDSSVLKLVSHAWAGFGAAFGPLVLLSLMWKRMNRNGALAGMIVGALTVIVWVYGGFEINGQPANDAIYSIMPGFLLSAITTVVVSLMTAPPKDFIVERFEKMEQGLK